LAEVTALVRRKGLRAAKIGGRGIWRIGRVDLDAYIERTYADTEQWGEGGPDKRSVEQRDQGSAPIGVPHQVTQPAS